jgi:hypothetical protein
MTMLNITAIITLYVLSLILVPVASTSISESLLNSTENDDDSCIDNDREKIISEIDNKRNGRLISWSDYTVQHKVMVRVDVRVGVRAGVRVNVCNDKDYFEY